MRHSVKRKSKASRRKKGGVVRTQEGQENFERSFRDLPEDIQEIVGRQVRAHHYRSAKKIQSNFRNFSRNKRRDLMMINIRDIAPYAVDEDDLIPLSDDQLEKLNNYLEAAWDAGAQPWYGRDVNELLHEANQYHNDPITYDWDIGLEGGKKKRKTRKKRLSKKRKY